MLANGTNILDPSSSSVLVIKFQRELGDYNAKAYCIVLTARPRVLYHKRATFLSREDGYLMTKVCDFLVSLDITRSDLNNDS